MQHGWIYEVIATTCGEHGPHAAPMGILTPDGVTLKAELFKGSKTLANFLQNQILGLNLVHDPVQLHDALYRRERLRFTFAVGEAVGVPFLENADAWLALHLTRGPETERTMILTATLAWWRAFGPVSLLNRAPGLLLESLVLSTRRHLLPPEAFRERLLENARVIAKTAPGSVQATAMEDLLGVMGLEGCPPPR